MLQRLDCVSWADTTRHMQVDLYDSTLTADQLADVIEKARWDGSSRGLQTLLGGHLGFDLDMYTDRRVQPDGDTVFVLWRKGG